MKNKIIVALDVDTFEKAKKLVDRLSSYADIFKVGSELFVSTGPRIIEYINRKRKKVFLDLKFYDIPNTVANALLAATRKNIFMTTLHASGGYDMLKKASLSVRNIKKKPILLGVTVLTSKKLLSQDKEVAKLAALSKKAGLNGIVCSPKETKKIKKLLGKNFIVVNPGIRPLWARKNDQARITTPKEAIENGADFIVIGRPITKAKDPVRAIKKIIEELK